ncbi:MAG: hypothetical protein ILP19_05110 [Oscillospiraceae bacterium]|nr:hypothetical protein [Oscillospiraceae bacterium]
MSKKNVIILSAVILVITGVLSGLLIRENYLRRAEYTGTDICFDGKVYEEVSFNEIRPYKETWKVVCKTADGVWTVYEIEQYPDHEYLIARTSWEARVLKLTDQSRIS